MKEEPKGHWFISEFGKVYSVEVVRMDRQRKKWLKQIGNYFSSKEEAEKAVEKLKAVKRLKDKGFKFNCYIRRSDWAKLREVKALENLIDITAYLPKDKIKEAEADLDFLFSGEEE